MRRLVVLYLIENNILLDSNQYPFVSKTNCLNQLAKDVIMYLVTPVWAQASTFIYLKECITLHSLNKFKCIYPLTLTYLVSKLVPQQSWV